MFRETTSTHHRKPTSIGGSDDSRNKIELPTKRHEAWHTLFQNWSADRIAAEINDRYIDPDYQLVVVKRINYAQALRGVAVFSQRATDRTSIYD